MFQCFNQIFKKKPQKTDCFLFIMSTKEWQKKKREKKKAKKVNVWGNCIEIMTQFLTNFDVAN